MSSIIELNDDELSFLNKTFQEGTGDTDPERAFLNIMFKEERDSRKHGKDVIGDLCNIAYKYLKTQSYDAAIKVLAKAAGKKGKPDDYSQISDLLDHIKKVIQDDLEATPSPSRADKIECLNRVSEIDTLLAKVRPEDTDPSEISPHI